MLSARNPRYEVRTYSRQHMHRSVPFTSYAAAKDHFNKAEKDRDDFVSILRFDETGPAAYLLTKK